MSSLTESSACACLLPPLLAWRLIRCDKQASRSRWASSSARPSGPARRAKTPTWRSPAQRPPSARPSSTSAPAVACSRSERPACRSASCGPCRRRWARTLGRLPSRPLGASVRRARLFLASCCAGRLPCRAAATPAQTIARLSPCAASSSRRSFTRRPGASTTSRGLLLLLALRLQQSPPSTRATTTSARVTSGARSPRAAGAQPSTRSRPHRCPPTAASSPSPSRTTSRRSSSRGVRRRRTRSSSASRSTDRVGARARTSTSRFRTRRTSSPRSSPGATTRRGTPRTSTASRASSTGGPSGVRSTRG